MICINKCPNKAIILSPSRIIGALALLFLPFDEWIKTIFSLNFSSYGKLADAFISLFIWLFCYIIVAFILNRLIILIDKTKYLKSIGQRKWIMKMRDEINPAAIFHVIER